MRQAGFAPPAHAGETRLLGELEALEVVEQPEAHKQGGEHRLCPPELLEEQGAVRAVLDEEGVEARVQGEHLLAESVALGRILVHHERVAGDDEAAFVPGEHVLDGAAIGVLLRDAWLRIAVVQVLHQHQALLEDLAVLELEHRQRRRPAGLCEQRGIAPLGDVYDLEAQLTAPLLQRKQDFETLAERTHRDVEDRGPGRGGWGHGLAPSVPRSARRSMSATPPPPATPPLRPTLRPRRPDAP